MSSITYFIILWRKAKSRKTLFENSTLWSRFTMQIPQWLSSICFITKRYELWHVISLEKLQAEAGESSRSHCLLSWAALHAWQPWKRYRNLPKGQESGGIRLRGYRNLRIHLCPNLKLRNGDMTIRKGLTSRAGDLMEQMHAGGLGRRPSALTLMENHICLPDLHKGHVLSSKRDLEQWRFLFLTAGY